MNEPRVYGPRLSYEAEAWLFRESAEAWADHKAILYCPDAERRKEKWLRMSESSRATIKAAMER